MCIRDSLRQLKIKAQEFKWPRIISGIEEISKFTFLDETGSVSNQTSASLANCLVIYHDILDKAIVLPLDRALHWSLIENGIYTIPVSIQNLQEKAFTKGNEIIDETRHSSMVAQIFMATVAVIYMIIASACERHYSKKCVDCVAEELYKVNAARIQAKQAGTNSFLETLESKNVDIESSRLTEENFSVDDIPELDSRGSQGELLFWIVLALGLIGLLFGNSAIDDRFIGISQLNRDLIIRSNAVQMLLPLLYQSIVTTSDAEQLKVKSRLTSLKEDLLQSTQRLSRGVSLGEESYLVYFERVERLEKFNICNVAGVIRRSRMSRESCLEIIDEGIGQGLNATLFRVFDIGWDVVSSPKNQLNPSERLNGREMGLIEKALKLIRPALAIQFKILENMRDDLDLWTRVLRLIVPLILIGWLLCGFFAICLKFRRTLINKNHLHWTLD
eukprot:TRINITY_DN4635_c0_g1_i1.p1 TRINITY_DN4635_c0_g1~~TRINITY_DN4635_c0_g1_i1.p1  ORF type:complete len:446 (+),score=56.72 TRINITY_DN4635_c0_g1_i1:64-1401(+)